MAQPPLYATFLLAILATALHAAPQQDPSQRPYVDELASAFAWYEGRQTVSLAKRLFVRVATGQKAQHGTEPATNTYLPAFLIEDRGPSFTVWTFDRRKRTFERSAKGTPEAQQVGYRPASWTEHLQALRKFSDLIPGGDPSYGRGLAGRRTSATTEVFLYAWVCHSRGEHEDATLIGQAAITLARSEQNPARDLQRHLENDFGKLALWKTCEAFGDLSENWTALLDRCDALLERYPKSKSAARCQELRSAIQTILQTEPPSGKSQVAMWIHELRNQNGRQFSQPGSVSIFMDHRGDESPAAKLAAIGMPAVESLLQVLDDTTLTRSVGFHRSFYFSHEIYRVGDCARDIINRIAGRSFPHSSRAEYRKFATRWWKDIRTRGERIVLSEAVIEASKNSPRQAVKLLERYPEDFIPVIALGIENAQSSFLKRRLIAVAGWCGSPAAPLLRRLQSEATDPSVRWAAATSLHPIDRQAATKAMLSLWRNQASIDASTRAKIGGYLAVCGSALAISALTEHPEAVDDHVIRALQAGSIYLTHTAIINPPKGASTVIAISPTQATRDASEHCLGQLLSVTRRLNGNFGGTHDPAIADFAARALAQLWPDRYQFDFAAVKIERQGAIRALQNVWRQSQGLAAHAVISTSRAPTDPRTDKFDRQLKRLLRASTETDRRRASDAIYALGYGTLPRLKSEIDRRYGPGVKPVRKHLTQIATRLGTGVSTSSLDPKSFETPACFQGHLNATAITTWIRNFVRSPPPGLSGFELSIDRGLGPSAALRVEVRLMPGSATNAKHVTRDIYVRMGRNGLLGSHGAGMRRVYERSKSFADFERTLNQALGTAFAPIEAHLKLQLR